MSFFLYPEIYGTDKPDSLPVLFYRSCSCRLAWIAAIDTDTMAPTWVYASYPASWLLLLVVLLVCWCRLYRRKIKPNIARNGAAA